MTWDDVLDYLRARQAVIDADEIATVTLQGAKLRVSWSDKTDEVGIVGNVATAMGLTEREIAAAGAGILTGKLVVVSERILLSHLTPASQLTTVKLSAILSSMASQIVTLRMRWSMPMFAA